MLIHTRTHTPTCAHQHVQWEGGGERERNSNIHVDAISKNENASSQPMTVSPKTLLPFCSVLIALDCSAVNTIVNYQHTTSLTPPPPLTHTHTKSKAVSDIKRPMTPDDLRPLPLTDQVTTEPSSRLSCGCQHPSACAFLAFQIHIYFPLWKVKN